MPPPDTSLFSRSLFDPVHPDVLSVIDAAVITVAGVIRRQELTPPTVPVERLTGPVMGVVSEVVKAIRDGTDLSAHYATIQRLINNQESRAEMIDQLLMTHDYTRLVDLTNARDRLEASLIQACFDDSLKPIERAVLLKEVSATLKGVETRVRAGATSVKDILSLLEKVDYSTSIGAVDLQKKFEKTSPQSRDVMRKVLSKMRKAIVQSATDTQVVVDADSSTSA